MITLSLDAADPWATNLRTAAADWPDSVRVTPQWSDLATIVVSVCAPGAAPGEVDAIEPGRGRAFIWSRTPLGPAVLTAWARRVVGHVVAARGGANGDGGTAWPSQDVVHEVALPTHPSAVRTTRRMTAELFAGHSRVDDIVLAGSELAANAVQHGGTAGVLAVSLTRASPHGGAVIEVADSSPLRMPRIIPLEAGSPSGRGMAIVDVVSDCWGVLQLADTKVVWCEFFDVGFRADE